MRPEKSLVVEIMDGEIHFRLPTVQELMEFSQFCEADMSSQSKYIMEMIDDIVNLKWQDDSFATAEELKRTPLPVPFFIQLRETWLENALKRFSDEEQPVYFGPNCFPEEM